MIYFWKQENWNSFPNTEIQKGTKTQFVIPLIKEISKILPMILSSVSGEIPPRKSPSEKYPRENCSPKKC